MNYGKQKKGELSGAVSIAKTTPFFFDSTQKSRTSRAEVHLQLQLLEMKKLNCERYTRFGSCWFQRKMVCWGGVRPRPGPRLPPLEGGGRQPCTGLLVVLPPVRKSPVSRSCCACCRRALACRKGCGRGGVAGRAQMHGADAPTHGADVCRVRDRPSERRA